MSTRRTVHDTAAALDRLIREHGGDNFFHFSEVRDAGGASPSAQRRAGTLHIDLHTARVVRGGWRVD